MKRGKYLVLVIIAVLSIEFVSARIDVVNGVEYRYGIDSWFRIDPNPPAINQDLRISFQPPSSAYRTGVAGEDGVYYELILFKKWLGYDNTLTNVALNNSMNNVVATQYNLPDYTVTWFDDPNTANLIANVGESFV